MLELDDVLEYERRTGEIEANEIVFIYTGWCKFLHVADRYRGIAEQHHADNSQDRGDVERDSGESVRMNFPGIHENAARYLIDKRISGIGIDTLSIDPGCSTSFSTHHLILSNGIWQLEGLTNLDLIPDRNFFVSVGVIKLKDGSGAPARVFAIVL